MKEGKEFLLVVNEFAREIGVPSKLILYPADEHGGNKVQKLAKECSMALKIIEELTQWAEIAEKYVANFEGSSFEGSS